MLPKSPSSEPPPKNWLKFLRWYCSPDFLEEVEGDLRERFEYTLATRGLAKARRQFAGGVLRFFNYSTIRGNGRRHPQQNIVSMYRNFLLIALRRLRREKGYAALHILGLSLGLSAALLLGIYIQYEKSYDQYLPNSERTYKLTEARTVQGQTTQRAIAPYAFARILPQRFPAVENASAVSGPYHEQQVTVMRENAEPSHFLEGNVYLADSNFLEVIPLEVLAGNRRTALQAPHSIVVTASTARRFFGEQPALGKELTVSGSPSVVTAVVADPPGNSQFRFSYLVSSASIRWFSSTDFSMASAHCFVTLQPGASPVALQAQLPELVANYVAPEMAVREGQSWEAFRSEGNDYAYTLRPLTSVHLDPDDIGQMKPAGNARLLSILTLVALLIVALSIVNYVNLATAKAAKRQHEVGVRKVLGSTQLALWGQFLTETALLTGLSVGMAAGLAFVVLPYFNALLHTQLAMPTPGTLVSISLSAWAIVTFLGGAYPTLVLASMRAQQVLKSSSQATSRGRRLRQALVTGQLSISLVLFVLTLVIFQQRQFISRYDLGYRPDAVVVLQGTFHRDATFTQPFLEEVRKLSGVKAADGTLWVQGFQSGWEDAYSTQPGGNVQPFNRVLVGDGYQKVMGLELMAGQFFSPETQDENNVVLNQSAVAALGLSDPIGATLYRVPGSGGELENVRVQGVIKDFHYHSLHDEMEPLVLRSNEMSAGRMKYIVMKLAGGNMAHTLEQVATVWHQQVPDRPFQYSFLNERMAGQYQAEATTNRLFIGATLLCLCLTLLGIIALAAFMVSFKTYEFAVRKVMGAANRQISFLVLREFLLRIAWAAVPGVPTAYFLANLWLQGYAYRMPLGALPFLAGLLAIAMGTLLPIALYAYKAGHTNPVRALKDY